MRFVVRISRNDDLSEVHFFTTHFYTQLATEGTQGVAKWTENKDINIFEKKMIFIPVHGGRHWSLSVIVNCGKIKNHLERRKIQRKNPKIELPNDSMPVLFF